MIHKTFSKQDLKDIIYDLNLTIPDYDSLNKHELIKKVILYFYNETEISFDDSLLFPNKDIEYVKDYLQKPNPHKLLSVKEKNNVLRLCKEIIHYCNNGFCIENTIFGSIEEIEIHLSVIKDYGDIPSVRRCCRLIKGDLKVNNIYEPKISLKMQRDLELKKQNKLMNKKVNTLIYKSGTFLIDFN
tara:strand:+ start:4064 stop:4621 length:558 start_codon:yes stop_codon:yes gene_type:complete